MIRSRRTAGTSLVEILVVIVVFLIGILAIVQIFPGGFRLLGLTRSQSVSTQLARVEIERLKAMGDQLPEKIIPVVLERNGSEVLIVADTNRRPNDIGPAADGLNQDGTAYNATGNLGHWRYSSGANTITRIVGEGSRVPAPRPVGNGANNFYGGLMNLQFGPIRYNATIGIDDPAAPNLRLVVYANDLEVLRGQPGSVLPKDYQCFVDRPEDPAAALLIAQKPSPPAPAQPVPYRMSFTAYINGPTPRAIDVVEYRFAVNPGPIGNYHAEPFGAIVASQLAPGETFVGVEFDSVQVNPVYEQIPKNTPFNADRPYQYKLIDDLNGAPLLPEANMGVLLFNPVAYSTYVPDAQGRRIPLTARVNYNVYDWGLMRDDVRIPNAEPFTARLKLGGIKVKGTTDTDGRTYNGLGFHVANGSGGSQELDVVVMDTETGAILTPNSYVVDKSTGSITFIDTDLTAVGFQSQIYDPDGWDIETISDSTGRSLRVFYETTQEHQVQVLTAASRYTGTSGPPSFGQIALGNPGTPDQATKMFFPWCDLGRKISIGEAYYFNGTDVIGPVTFSGVVTAPRPVDSVQLPSVDIKLAFNDAERFDASKYGFAVRYVRGASVAVRVLWNPAKFRLVNNTGANLNAFDKWGQNWRKSITETYLQKGGQQ